MIRATNTPWGRADSAHQIAKGWMDYTTSSHGGMHLSKILNALVPDYMRNEEGWYEEDCAWAIPVIALAGKVEANFENQLNPASTYFHAFETFKNWYPEQFERFFRVSLKPGESYRKDEMMGWKKPYDKEKGE